MLFILPGAGGGFMQACRRIHRDEIPAHRFNLCWQLEIKTAGECKNSFQPFNCVP